MLVLKSTILQNMYHNPSRSGKGTEMCQYTVSAVKSEGVGTAVERAPQHIP